MAAPQRAYNPVALRVAMARRHVTAPELAAKIGKRSSKITRYMLGINEPSDDDMRQIARALEWPIGFFRNPAVEWPSEAAFS